MPELWEHEHINMHFRLQSKNSMVKSVKSVLWIINKRKRWKIQLLQIKVKTREGWLFRVKTENKNMSTKKKKASNLGLFAVQMLHKSSMCSALHRPHLHRLFHNPVIAALPISFCATRRYQSFLIFGSRLTILLPCETQSCFVRLWLQICRFRSELRVCSRDTVPGNPWSMRLLSFNQGGKRIKCDWWNSKLPGTKAPSLDYEIIQLWWWENWFF